MRWTYTGGKFGRWLDEDGKPGFFRNNFRASVGRYDRVIVIMTENYMPAGHGEPSYTDIYPKFYDESTLEEIPYKDGVTLEPIVARR